MNYNIETWYARIPTPTSLLSEGGVQKEGGRKDSWIDK